jgi:hypothetical protein
MCPSFFTQYDWFIWERDSEHLRLFGRAVPEAPGGSDYGYATFSRDDGVWQPAGWGGCRIEIAAPGFGNASWVVDETAPLDPSAELVRLRIQEKNCASGQAPVHREVVPVVVAEDDRITITVLVEPVQGVATCPANPWHQIIVDLGEPLGDRALFDGSSLPPTERVP